MKLLTLVFIFVVGINKAKGGEYLTKAPIVVDVFPYCTLDGSCKISITFENLSNFQIQFFSPTFVNNSPTYLGVIGLSGEEFRKMKDGRGFKRIPQKIENKKASIVPLNELNFISIEPLQKKAFTLDALEKTYNFKVADNYVLGYFLSIVHFYIDGKYALTTSLGSEKYALLYKPSENLKPEIENISKAAIKKE